MNKLGFGQSFVGSSRVGYGRPADANSTTAKLYLLPDGTKGDAALIDFEIGDYVINENGNFVGTQSIPKMVKLALLTMKNSSIVDDFGFEANDYTGPINIQVIQKVKRGVFSALKHMTSNNQIMIVDVQVDRPKDNKVSIIVQWLDVLTNELSTTVVI